MDSIKKYLKNIQKEEVVSKVKFSVVLDDIENARLEYIAKHLNLSRAGLAHDLIMLGVEEIERQLELDPDDTNSDYGKALGWDTDFGSVDK